MGDFEGIAQLGEGSPSTQIAKEVKRIREDVHHLASGFRKLKVDLFTSADRKEEWERIERSYAEEEEKKA